MQKGVEYRSEIPLFLCDRLRVKEQRAIYRQQLSHFANKPVIMRTLDIGALEQQGAKIFFGEQVWTLPT